MKKNVGNTEVNCKDMTIIAVINVAICLDSTGEFFLFCIMLLPNGRGERAMLLQ